MTITLTPPPPTIMPTFPAIPLPVEEEEEEHAYPMTCVSGYWKVKSKRTNSAYENWFKNTLAINCPYVFFGDRESIAMAREFRKTFPTVYVECALDDFVTNSFKGRMITHPTHCPSIELNLVWNEKIFLVKKAAAMNPFKSEFFKWIDAGHCRFRARAPPSMLFPDKAQLAKLPKNKLIFSSSTSPRFQPELVTATSYYHHVSGIFVVHAQFVEHIADVFFEYLGKLLDKKNIWTDQVVWTHILRDNPDKFHKLCDGYGAITTKLYGLP